MPDERHIAVLVGNGLSIAFNPALNLRAITTEMVELMRAASDDGSDVVTAMKEIAERALPAEVTSEDDFEILVGAFGAERRTMGYLERLAALTQPQDQGLQAAIQRVAAFAARVRDTGLSHVLQVIFENSHAYSDDAEHLHAFVSAIEGAFDGRVTFANLNYDTLLLSAVLTVCDLSQVVDLAHGARWVTVVDTDGNTVAHVPALRTSASEFPSSRRIRLLHLHGSITYWARKDGAMYAKLSREHLEDLEQWQAVRDDTTSLRPVVVLANQRDKSAHVQEYPFNLAVNAKLRAEFNDRAREEKPRVLVVTHGDDLAAHDVERAFGWGQEDGSSVDWLTIVRAGADRVERTADWDDFIA